MQFLAMVVGALAAAVAAVLLTSEPGECRWGPSDRLAIVQEAGNSCQLLNEYAQYFNLEIDCEMVIVQVTDYVVEGCTAE